MADSRPNHRGRSPDAPEKQSPVRLRPISRVLQLPKRRAHGSCEDREGPAFAVESDLSGDMVVRDQELDAIIRLLGATLDNLFFRTERE